MFHFEAAVCAGILRYERRVSDNDRFQAIPQFQAQSGRATVAGLEHCDPSPFKSWRSPGCMGLSGLLNNFSISVVHNGLRSAPISRSPVQGKAIVDGAIEKATRIWPGAGRQNNAA